MSRPSKEYEYRMQGMIYALNIARKEGVEALEKDIKKRGFFRAPMKFTQKDIDGFIEFLSQNLFATSMAVWFMALHNLYGFGKNRLERLKAEVERLTIDATDFDYLGNHYATLEDYAIYLNGKYELGLDSERVAAVQSVYSKEKNHKMANVDEVTRILKENGYDGAAGFLEERI